MAQYTVKHACGHTVTHKLYGAHKDRYRKVEWMEGEPCPDCHRAAEEKKVREFSASLNLPPLVGTEKQIAWGEKIRAEAMRSKLNELPDLPTDENIKAGSEKVGIPVDDALRLSHQFADEVRKAEAKLRTETSAAWWIENRGETPSYVRGAYERAYKRFSEAVTKIKSGSLVQ